MMEEPLLDRSVHIDSSTQMQREKSTSQEMEDMASDQHTEVTGKVITKMDEYEVITDPSAGRWGRYRRRQKESDNSRTRTVTWGGRTTQSFSETPGLQAHLTRSPTHGTTYSTMLDPTIEHIQEQYDQEGYNMIRRGESVSSQFPSEGVTIDGRYSLSVSQGDIDEDFISIDSLAAHDMSTTRALEMCNNYVLKPYNTFLKLIGWRVFRTLRLERVPWYKRLANVVYPGFIFFMLLFASCAQVITCFSRSQATAPDINVNGSFILNCESNVLSQSVLGDILLLVAYVWAFYIFRYSETEHLSTLIETVFLSYNNRLIRQSQRRLVFVLLTFLLMGVVWVLFSTIATVGRIFALKLHEPTTTISWFLNNSTDPTSFKSPIDDTSDYDIIHYTFLSVAILGFIFFDLLYIAIVINYSSQCQLLHFYVINIKDKVRHKAYQLGDAVREIYRVHEFLRVLNGKLSFVTSLAFFIFLQGAVSSYMDYMNVKSGNTIGIIVGLANLIQWTTAAMLPVIQASRLTAACKGLKKLGLEIGSRPFVYSDTPQLVLDSFLLYTHATNYQAKLGFVSIKAEYIFGFLFLLGLLFSLYPIFVSFRFAAWI